jgi:hypothetical protein
MSQEQRRHARYDSLNLLHFAMPSGPVPEMQGMGRTLNVSESGLLLETQEPLDSNGTIELTIGLGDDLVTIEGETIHCRPTPDHRYNTGIRFSQISDSARVLLDRYIQLFEERQQNR